jgi:hypothetical protein
LKKKKPTTIQKKGWLSGSSGRAKHEALSSNPSTTEKKEKGWWSECLSSKEKRKGI